MEKHISAIGGVGPIFLFPNTLEFEYLIIVEPRMSGTMMGGRGLPEQIWSWGAVGARMVVNDHR